MTSGIVYPNFNGAEVGVTDRVYSLCLYGRHFGKIYYFSEKDFKNLIKEMICILSSSGSDISNLKKIIEIGGQ